jgi:AraC-like DNA-binding protein
VAGAKPSALDAARCLARGAEMHDPLAWTERASAAARTLVMRGELSGARLARALDLHPRTLRRRLGEEGSGVRGIFDAVRCSLACELPHQTQLPLDEIASTLGFADASAFVRAFRAWAGCTPGRWRAQQRLNPPPARG